MQRAFGIISSVLIVSGIFYAIGTFLAIFFVDYLTPYIGIEFSQLEKIVYGGLVIMILGWIVLIMIIKSKEHANKINQESHKETQKIKKETEKKKTHKEIIRRSIKSKKPLLHSKTPQKP